MTPAEIKLAIQNYILLQKDISEITEKLHDLTDQSQVISQALTSHVPEEFIYSYEGVYYRFFMDIEEGGIHSFEPIESLNQFLAQQREEADASEES